MNKPAEERWIIDEMDEENRLCHIDGDGDPIINYAHAEEIDDNKVQYVCPQCDAIAPKKMITMAIMMDAFVYVWEDYFKVKEVELIYSDPEVLKAIKKVFYKSPYARTRRK